ncbi:MAG: hypothetical protein LCH74_03445 [Proteobacteria bacterium]|nr:hypothetical protein [Pseudomonadota bacterium]
MIARAAIGKAAFIDAGEGKIASTTLVAPDLIGGHGFTATMDAGSCPA